MKVYTARREENFFKLLKSVLLGFKEGRELAWRLFVRDRKANYRKSMLGFFWIFLPPIATALIWVFLKQQKVVAIQDVPMPYTAFVVVGTLCWSLFAESIMKPLQRYQASMSMMTKLNFPREAIILASFYDIFFSVLLKITVLVPILWMLGFPPTWAFLPAMFCMLTLALAGLTLGLFISPFGLLYGDVGKALPVVLPFCMYLTPVIYPQRAFTGLLALIQKGNPVIPFLERARSLFGSYEFQLNTELLWWSIILLIMLVVGIFLLRLSLPIIVERSGS